MLQLDDGPLMHMVRLARDVGPPAREQELRDFLGQFRFTGDDGQPGGGLAVRRREGAPGAGHAGVAAPQPAAAGRADQPPRPDDARGAVDRAQRVRRHGDAGQPRPRAAARGLRRVLAGQRRPACSPSTATSTTTSAGCSRCRAPRPQRPAAHRPGSAAAEADAAVPQRRHRAQPRRKPAHAGVARRAQGRQAGPRQALRRTRPLRVELQQIDARLARLAAEKAEVEAALAGASVAARRLCRARAPPDPRRRRDATCSRSAGWRCRPSWTRWAPADRRRARRRRAAASTCAAGLLIAHNLIARYNSSHAHRARNLAAPRARQDRLAAARPPAVLRAVCRVAGDDQAVQAAARPAGPDLPAVPGDAGAVAGRRPHGVAARRAPGARFRHADAAAQAPGSRRPGAAPARHRRRTPRAAAAHTRRPRAEGPRPARAADHRRRHRAANSANCPR